MSNVSLFGKKWIDLVFEGKNKEYGAYQLRQETPRTTITALFFGLLFFGAIGGAGIIFSSFSSTPNILITPPLPELPHVTKVDFDDLKPPTPVVPENKPNVVMDDVTKKNLTNVVVVTPDEHPDDIAPNKTPATNPDAITDANNSGTVTTGTTTNTTTSTAPAATVPSSGIYRNGSLDKLPEFPGGIKKFNVYIANHFEKPDLGTVKTLKVLVSFVIETDGSISDIKVLENPGNGLDKEAIRVLQSLRTKWKPGIKDGKPVRTLFTLPISIVTE